MRHRNGCYILWAIITIILAFLAPLLVIKANLSRTYTKNISLICSPDYTNGFLLYSKAGDKIHIGLKCVHVKEALLNLTIIGNVNKTMILRCGETTSLHMTRSGLTLFYLRVIRCSGDKIWLIIRP